MCEITVHQIQRDIELISNRNSNNLNDEDLAIDLWNVIICNQTLFNELEYKTNSLSLIYRFKNNELCNNIYNRLRNILPTIGITRIDNG